MSKYAKRDKGFGPHLKQVSILLGKRVIRLEKIFSSNITIFG